LYQRAEWQTEDWRTIGFRPPTVEDKTTAFLDFARSRLYI